MTVKIQKNVKGKLRENFTFSVGVFDQILPTSTCAPKQTGSLQIPIVVFLHRNTHFRIDIICILRANICLQIHKKY